MAQVDNAPLIVDCSFTDVEEEIDANTGVSVVVDADAQISRTIKDYNARFNAKMENTKQRIAESQSVQLCILDQHGSRFRWQAAVHMPALRAAALAKQELILTYCFYQTTDDSLHEWTVKEWTLQEPVSPDGHVRLDEDVLIDITQQERCNGTFHFNDFMCEANQLIDIVAMTGQLVAHAGNLMQVHTDADAGGPVNPAEDQFMYLCVAE